ncbi:hypothetical protein [Staphylococcus aureus]|uniref:phage baseplate protein n=1 Tax=Staphylococcus aureus TaxID=1280 RepID=UPI0013039EB3|nr:hypothetical protein [Staphylococcus aureus]
MVNLIKSLDLRAGSEYRRQNVINFQRIEQAFNDINNRLYLHTATEKTAHQAWQIKYGNKSQADVNKDLQNQINRLVLAPRNNSANEIVQARGDGLGNTYETLKSRLDAWEARTAIDKEETIKSFNKSKKEILDIEYRFEPDKQEFLFVTELAPLTNAVMQSFWFDNRTGIVYMTQARNNGYTLSRLRPNGQFIDSSLIVGGGHGTHNGYRYIDGTLWIYSHIKNENNENTLVRFKYTPNVEMRYGQYGMQDVFTGHPDKPYITPVINEKEEKILYRVERPRSEWEIENSMNYIEIRNLDDVDKNIDNVLHRISIPMSLTNQTQPMQGVAFDESTLYWYTGDSKPDNPNYLTAFDLKTGRQLYQVNADYGGVLHGFPGDFAEAEGMQVYYDYDTGKKGLMLGVTVGGSGNRTHRIFMIGQRGILETLHSRGIPFIMSDTGGRTKPLPMSPESLTSLAQLKEPGFYYLYTDHTLKIDDFPLPRQWRDAGWFVEVKPPQTGGDIIQILTRNSYGRNMMTFERVISGRGDGTSDWNYVPKNSGKWERVPDFITNMKDLNIVGMSFYLTTADTNRLAGFPNSRKNVAGWNLKILASNTGGFIHQLIRNSVSAPTEMLLKNYDSPSESGPWTLLRGEIIN